MTRAVIRTKKFNFENNWLVIWPQYPTYKRIGFEPIESKKNALESSKFLNQNPSWAKTHYPFALYITEPHSHLPGESGIGAGGVARVFSQLSSASGKSGLRISGTSLRRFDSTIAVAVAPMRYGCAS